MTRFLLTPAAERTTLLKTKQEIMRRAAEYGYQASYSGHRRKWFFTHH